MKTVLTELAFLFVWISLCFGRGLQTGGNRPSICSLPKVTGGCRAAFHRWYYNIDSNKCEQFLYGGCDGNKNNFETKDECQGNCITNTAKGDHPSRLLKLFGGKNARAADRTNVRFRREDNTTSHDEGEEAISSLRTPEISPSITQENSPDPSKNGTKSLSHEESERSDGELQPQSQGEEKDKTVVSSTERQSGNDKKTSSSPSQSKNESENDVKTTASPSQSKDESNAVNTTGIQRLSDKGNGKQDVESQPQAQAEDNVKTVVSSTERQSGNDKKTSSSPSQSKNESDGVKTAGIKHLSDKKSEKKDDQSQPKSQDKDNVKTVVSSTERQSGNDKKTSSSPSQSKNESDGVKTAGIKRLSDKKSGKKNGELQPESQDKDNVKSGSKAVETTGAKRLSHEESERSDGESQPQSKDEDNVKEDNDDTLDISAFQNSRKDSAAYPYEHTSSHFAAFFLTSIVMVFAAYVVYHNRQKIIAIVIEGRSEGTGKRRGYRKLETNVEEAMPSLKSSNSTYVY